MKKESKRRAAGGAVYVFCALMLATILAAAWLSAIGGSQRGYTKIEVTGAADVVTDEAKRPVPAVTEPPATTAAHDTTAQSADTEAEPASVVPDVFVAPVAGPVTKPFNNELAVYSLTMNDYRAHCGVDVDAPLGTPVVCAADGIVDSITDDPFMGKTVCVRHGGDLKSRYMGLDEVLPDNVVPGASLDAGDVLGFVGATAAAEAADPPHLHVEFTLAGVRVDPLAYFQPVDEAE